MRIVFIGCVDFSHALLEKTLTLPEAEVVGIVTRESSSFNADFCSLKPLADKNGIPCFLDAGNRQAEMAAWVATLTPSVVYCFGWPYLLGKAMLENPPLGVVGYHPTALPRNRGRHPIIWTLALGLTETASTFFFMDEGADSGDLLSQRSLEVKREDNAATLYAGLKELALSQLPEFTSLLASNKFIRIPQDHACANYWRKRSKIDGKIDWRMPSEGIYNLVRALTKPYPGAHLEYEGSEIKVWQCEVLSKDCQQDEIFNIAPGCVLAATDAGVDIRCGDGVVRLTRHELSTLPQIGAYL
jgi:methionyl-tRNA formyltransferase